jgi:hypothetical protein
MVDTANQEVIRAAFDTRTGTSPQEKLAQQVRQKAEESQAVTGFAAALKEQQSGVIDPSRISTAVESIGWKLKPDGTKDRTSDEITRHTSLQTNTAELQAYLKETDFSELNSTMQGKVLTALDSLIMRTPELSSAMESIDPAVRRTMLEGLMNNRKFANRVQEVFGRNLDIGDLKEDLVSQAQAEYEVAKRVYEQKRRERLAISGTHGTLNQIEEELEKYQAPSVGKRKGGVEYERMKTAKSTFDTLSPSYDERKAKVDHLQESIKQMEQHRLAAISRGRATDAAASETEIRRLNTELGPAEVLLAEGQKHKNIIDEYNTDKEKLEKLKNTLAHDLIKLQDEEAQLGREMYAKQGHLEQERLNRAGLEQDLVNRLDPKNLFATALTEYLHAEAPALEAAQKEVDKERVEKATSDQQKAVEHAVETRWDTIRKGRWFGRERNTPDAGRIKADFTVLMQQGPEAYLKQLGVTEEALLNNTEFRSVMIQKLLQKKLETGGIQEGEAKRIFDSGWGTGLIENAMAHNANFKDFIKKTREAGIITNSTAQGIKEFFNRHPVLRALLVVLVWGSATGLVASHYPVAELARYAGMVGNKLVPQSGSVAETIGGAIGPKAQVAAGAIGSKLP